MSFMNSMIHNSDILCTHIAAYELQWSAKKREEGREEGGKRMAGGRRGRGVREGASFKN